MGWPRRRFEGQDRGRTVGGIAQHPHFSLRKGECHPCPVQRRVDPARQLGLEKPWLYDPKPTIECPVCAERIKPGVAVCRACGAILDREKAARFGLARAPRKERQRNPEPQAEQRNEAGS